MKRRALFVLLVALFSGAQPAAAFWPFTTNPPPALPDSAVQARVAARYDKFKTRTEEVVSPAAASAAAGVAAGTTVSTQGAPGGVAPGTTMSTQQGATPGTTYSTQPGSTSPPPPPAPADSATAAMPFSSAIAGLADSLAATPGDTLAAATSSGPFGGLTPNPNAPPTVDPAAMTARANLERGFAPELTSKFDQSNDNMRATNDVAATFTDPSGITLRSALSYGADFNLNQDTDTRTTGFNNNLNMPLTRHGVNFGISTTNSRMNQEGARNIATSTNNFIDTRSGQATLAVSRRLTQLPIGGLRRAFRGWSANASYARRVGARLNTTVSTTGTGSGEVRHKDSGNSFGVGAGFDGWKWMTIRGRWGTANRRNEDQLSVNDPTRESKSEGDTSSVDVNLPKIWRFTAIAVSFDRMNTDDTTPEAQRTASGSQSGQVGNFVLERHTSVRDMATLSARFAPVKRLDIGISANGSSNSDIYVIRRDQINETERIGGKIDSRLSFWRGATFVANYEQTWGEIDQDTPEKVSPNTRQDKMWKLYTELSKRISRTSLKAYYEVQLDQSWYRNVAPQGKGDRDDYRQRLGGEMSSTIADSAVTVIVTAYVRSYDQAYLDPRRSALSRNEREYVVRPGYVWRLTRRVTLRQNYGLSSKVIDEVFPNPATGQERDTISRNHFMNTGLDFTLTQRALANVSYDYVLQDNGLYPLVDGVRLFAPSQRTKKDFIGVGFRYDIIAGGKLTFVSRQESSRLHNFRFVGSDPGKGQATNQGNLALGFESHLAVHGLTLDCRVQRNRSFNSFLNRDVFYNVDALLKYIF